MRASFWVIAPLLARKGEAKVALPGGCSIGTRPIELLLMVLRRLGATVRVESGHVLARATSGLRGTSIHFPCVTVGGTHLALMAACLASGTTLIWNAAREPEVVDVAECLIKMGARIQGAGTSMIRVHGVARLVGARHRVIPDRIEAGTYAMAAAAIPGGHVFLRGAPAEMLSAVIESLGRAGVEVESSEGGVRIVRRSMHLRAVQVAAEPYPGFPTDLQAPLMALMTCASGASRLTDTVYEDRFRHVEALNALGADISVQGREVVIQGADQLKGAVVVATDLRAFAALVIAGLTAEGTTIIHGTDHLDRGYEALEQKLLGCDVKVKRVNE